MYKFIKPILKVFVGFLVNKTTFALLEVFARIYMFLLFCMAFIFYLNNRIDAAATFVIFILLVNFSLRFLDKNLWKINLFVSNFLGHVTQDSMQI